MKRQEVKVRNARWDETEFLRERKEVLSRWRTGKEVDLEEAFQYIKSLPNEKNVALKVKDAKEKGYCLTQPRGGFPLLDDMIRLHRILEEADKGMILLPVTTDSYTRSERFNEIENELYRSSTGKKSSLNGFPTVNHGVKSCRKLQSSTSQPLYGIGGNPLPCLTAEISFASGITGFIGSGVCTPIGYSKHVSIEQGIRNFQYVDRLVSFYSKKGVPLYREATGFLTWVLVPPGIEIALNLIDAALAAEQGIRYYGLGHSAQLHLVQDMATVLAMQETAEEFLKTTLGYRDIELFITLLSYGGSFPENVGMAYGTIAIVGAVAGLTKVQGVSVKTVDEAIAVPTAENNALGVKATRQALNIIGSNRYPVTSEVEFEKNLLKQEVRSILHRVMEIGDGDLAVGSVLAFEDGVLDCPWSPNLCLKGKMLGARDHSGAVRYLNPGNVPIPKEVLDYHQEALAKRAEKEKKELGYELVLEDLLRIAKGESLTV